MARLRSVREVKTAFKRWILVCVFGGVTLLTTATYAQLPAMRDSGLQIEVSLVTFGPGKESWQRFGHNAIWVRDPARGINTLYNYGKFSFEEENFILRFIQGHMRYWVEAQAPEETFQMYKFMNRSIYVQDLALTSDQRLTLRDFLEWNVQPENAFYDYDYYTDNCSTRLRDVIDDVVGAEIKRQTHAVGTSATFRFHTQRLTTQNPLLYTGLLLALGNPVDRPLTVWDDMFIPMQLREHIRTVMIPGERDKRISLVAREWTVFEGTRQPLEEVYIGVYWYLLVGLLIALLFLWLGATAARSRFARFIFTGVTGLWVLVIGLAGLILAGLWLATDHFDAAYNENLFFVTPLALPLVLLLPLAVYRKRHATRYALIFCCIVAGSALIGLGIQMLPGFDQINGPIIAVTVPPHLAMWFALMWQLYPTRFCLTPEADVFWGRG